MQTAIQINENTTAVITYYPVAELDSNSKYKTVDNAGELVIMRNVVRGIRIFELQNDNTTARVFDIHYSKLWELFKASNEIIDEKLQPVPISEIEF